MSIITRWLRGSLLPMVLVVAVAETLLLYNLNQSLYNTARRSIQARFDTVRGQMAIVTASTARGVADSRSLLLHRMVEQFDQKERYEFMLLDAAGNVLSTSSGLIDQTFFSGQDYRSALESGTGMGEEIYTTGQGERVLSMTMLVPYAAQEVAALRMVTSLALIDQALYQYATVALAIGAVILIFSALSGVFFVRSIVRPLAAVEATANRIARGDLSVRLPAGNAADEVGRLGNTINQMAEALGETERMKNEFISSVSHELRTPLTSIRGWMETISSIRDPEDENYRKGLAIVGSETERLYNMVEELLDFSRLQTGIRLDCQPLDLVAELTDAALFMQARIEKEGLHLDYDEPEVLLPVWADSNRLRQVFINILDNAVKYSLPGGAIHIELLSEIDHVYVRIRDEGRGIAPDDLENVKLKFFKGKNAVRGSGIGLAVVDEIMTAMDGAVDITSTLNEGTTVTLRLPHYRAADHGGE